MDWLSAQGTMSVNWLQKWLAFYYKGHRVCLQGDLPTEFEFTVVELQLIQDTQETKVTVMDEVPPEIQAVLDQFAAVFYPPTELPPRRSCDHRIPLVDGARPVNIRPYRYTPELKSEIERQVPEMLASGVISPSTSPFASPIILVRKKDGSWRLCVDYRHLNMLTLKTKYPLPVIDELLDELSGASWFSKLDLRAGYHQIRLAPGEEYKTAFHTHNGHYEFNVVAFGLTGGPATFQSEMNETLSPVLRKYVVVFFDDILVFSATLEEHVVHLRTVLQLLQQNHWKVKVSKCEFAKRTVSYLGFVVSEQGVSTDPSKVQGVLNWPVPQNLKELRGFLGLSGYYHKFVQHYGVISQPLTQLLRKNVPFVWIKDTQTAFDVLKTAVTSAPVLALPNFKLPFTVETDASDTGVGAVLLQQGHPLAFVSKGLGPRTRGLSTYEKEYMAILLVVEQWRAYLQHSEFLILTDHCSLAHLEDQRLHTTWQQKVFTKLLGLRFKIKYKKGSENRVADALSRRPHPDGELLALTVQHPAWLQDVVATYRVDQEAQELLTRLSIHPEPDEHYSLHNGLIRYKKRVWLPSASSLISSILEAFHSSPLGGHSGVPVTLRRLKQLFYWKGMSA